MRRDLFARLIFYWRIDNSVVGVNLDTSGGLIDPNANLGKTRANENKTESKSPNEAAR